RDALAVTVSFPGRPAEYRLGEHPSSTDPTISKSPPTKTVFPSAESATEKPCSAFPMASVPTSSIFAVHTPFERVNTSAPPSASPTQNRQFAPTIAVFPSLDSTTEPTSASSACWLQMPFDCVNTHEAPAEGAAEMAVFPSAEIETEAPCRCRPVAPV